MGKRGFKGKSLKFYLMPEAEFNLKTAMQKDGYLQRGPYLDFLLKQRDEMRQASVILAAWQKRLEAEAILASVVK